MRSCKIPTIGCILRSGFAFITKPLSFSFMTAETAPRHIGRKIVRIRELRGMKQETLAGLLGVSQQTVSKPEQSEEVDEARLKAVAEALGVTPAIIRSFNEDTLLNNIQHNSDTASHNINVKYEFNPLEKVEALYERLLKSEQEKVAMLQALLDKFQPAKE